MWIGDGFGDVETDVSSSSTYPILKKVTTIFISHSLQEQYKKTVAPHPPSSASQQGV